MKKNSEFKIVIEGYDADGLGVCQVDGRELKVAGACAQDELEIKIDHLSQHKPVGWASIVSVLSRGAEFKEPACVHAFPFLGKCGGCPLLHLSQNAQEKIKKQRVEQALQSNDIQVTFQHQRAPNTMGYRNRAHYVAARSSTGNATVLGSYAPRSHHVVSMSGCGVVYPKIEAGRKVIAELINKLNIPPHPAPHGLRYLTFRAAYNGELMMDVTTNTKAPPWLRDFCDRAIKNQIAVGITHSVNNDSGNAMRIASSCHYDGVKSILEQTRHISLRTDASTFYQLNSEVAHRMYSAVADLLQSPVDVLWDLYCGVGGLGLTCAKQGKAKQVFGVEFAQASLIHAREAATKHQLSATFHEQDLSRAFPSDWPAPQAIIVNPPRRGCDEPVMDVIKNTKPKCVIYMSCSPKSFARDARRIIDSGYTLNHLESHDMLPQTHHVELLARFIESN